MKPWQKTSTNHEEQLFKIARCFGQLNMFFTTFEGLHHKMLPETESFIVGFTSPISRVFKIPDKLAEHETECVTHA